MATMQSQELSFSISQCTYHVFLSFRGIDTRKTFADHLHTALVQAGLHTFRDDEEIEIGEYITLEVQKAIVQSKCSVVVFSKSFASSKWCLDELLMILEHKRNYEGHVVLPIYYDTEPTEVRKQTGYVAKALARCAKQLKVESDMTDDEVLNKIKQWKKALKEVADLGGMVVQNHFDGHESKFIQKIVQVIKEKLNHRFRLSLTPYLVGVQSRVRDITLWLQDVATDVNILLICGMGGIGKTTTAKFVYNLNFERFESSSFLANVRETAAQENGLLHLQRQLLSDILKNKAEKVSIDEGINKIKDAVNSKRVLVLDDVDQDEQLTAALGMRDWFFCGSKIIITTRQERLLKAYRGSKVYRVERLDNNESLQLFSWHAFAQELPAKGYQELSKRIVHHCGGLPLALQVLGSSLSGRSLNSWVSAIKKLEVIPDSQILNKLRISYESLQDDHDKNLFLHIACFFNGKDKDFTIKILDECDFFTTIGIENLVDRNLLEIDKNNKLKMHRLLQEMGKEIIYQASPREPGKRSRLWHHQDSFYVLREKKGTETIEGLVLDMHMLKGHKFAETPTGMENAKTHSSPEIIDKSAKHHFGFFNWNLKDIDPTSTNDIILKTNAFEGMHKLRFLLLNNVKFTGHYSELPRSIKWLRWCRSPLKSIPRDFPLESLVALEMRYSKLERIFKEAKHLLYLKILNLSHSYSLSKTPDFLLLPNLERLILKDCTSLVNIHESIGCLSYLAYLSLRNCKILQCLPESMGMLKSLETLDVSGCSSLNVWPNELRKLRSLKVLHADTVALNRMFSATEEAKTAQASICSWLFKRSKIKKLERPSLPQHLVSLSLVDCNLSEVDFPQYWNQLSMLRNLNLSKNPIQSLPDCIRGLTRLRVLRLNSCPRLQSVEGLPKVEILFVGHCTLLEKISYLSPLCKPKLIEHTACGKLVDVEGLIKLESFSKMANYWSFMDMATLEKVRVNIFNSTTQSVMKLPIQVLHEVGISSTFIPGKEVPSRFSIRSSEPSQSFPVFLPRNLSIKGLNICCVYALASEENWTCNSQPLLYASISNKTKNLKGHYVPTRFGIPDANEEIMWLSYWEIGNQMDLENGDEVEVLVLARNFFKLKEFGIDFVCHEPELNQARQDHFHAPKYAVRTRFHFLSKQTLSRDDIFLPILNSDWDESIFDSIGIISEDEELHKPDHSTAAETEETKGYAHSQKGQLVVLSQFL